MMTGFIEVTEKHKIFYGEDFLQHEWVVGTKALINLREISSIVNLGDSCQIKMESGVRIRVAETYEQIKGLIRKENES
jgi:hypothetical protein